MKVCLTVLLLGAFLEQGNAFKCYECGDGTTSCSDPLAQSTDESYTSCTIYKDAGDVSVRRGGSNYQVCGTEVVTVGGGKVWTCDTELCNDVAVTAEAVPKPETCKTCETCDECSTENSGTKTNRGFGVIMTSVSLSYVITKFL